MQRSFVNVEAGKGWIIIQSVLGKCILNTFFQRAKHKVMVNPGSLMKTEVPL